MGAMYDTYQLAKGSLILDHYPDWTALGDRPFVVTPKVADNSLDAMRYTDSTEGISNLNLKALDLQTSIPSPLKIGSVL